MCVMSMVMDHYGDKWEKYLKPPYTTTYHPMTPAAPASPFQVMPGVPAISKEEIEEFRRLLERAREYDKKHNEPDCELESKRQRLLDLAKELGIDIEFVKAKS